ncbi:MAG: hypothetical protein QOI16_768 [Pseudonocardiales bacterium]|nr:hypothetical protein [Pseudonocardiales bacterium]
MDHADHMGESIDVAVAAIRGADPARFADRSPCTDWTIGQEVNHLAFGLVMAEYGARKAAWPQDWTEDERCPYLRDVPEAEWADRAAEAGAAAARAWSDPAAWEGDAPFGSSSMPAAMIGSMMTGEFVVHGWDIAAATGQPITVPEPLAATVLAGVESIAGMGREGGWFGAEVQVPAGASTLDRALAASGRDPAWKR